MWIRGEMIDHCYALAVCTRQTPPNERECSDRGGHGHRTRQKKRVNIGIAFSRWKALMADKGFRNDAEVACFLLDRVCGEPSSTSQGRRKRSQKSTAEPALQTKETPKDLPQPCLDQLSGIESDSSSQLQSATTEVRRICQRSDTESESSSETECATAKVSRICQRSDTESESSEPQCATTKVRRICKLSDTESESSSEPQSATAKVRRICQRSDTESESSSEPQSATAKVRRTCQRLDTDSESSSELQSTTAKVRRICHDLPPNQPDKQQTEDESDIDDMTAFAAPSPSTDEDCEMQWGEMKDEISQTTQLLQERLEAMRSLSAEASEPILETGGKENHEEVTWMSKQNLTRLFKTCHQCEEPVREFKTLTSGSLVRIQWECTKGHLMWLFHSYNPT